MQQGKTLQCEQHHTFDIAKEGYVNLVTRKLRASVGDTKEMLSARRRFLDAGFYQPLSDALNTLVAQFVAELSASHDIVLLDAGCGEGYYLGRLQAYLKQHQSYLKVAECLPVRTLHCFGLDISKEAIRMAARHYKDIQFVVADLNERLVVADSAVHVLLNIFAPRNVEEFVRILAPNAILLVVIPGAGHLSQLRETLSLLAIQENKPRYVEEQFAPYLRLVTTTSIRYTMHLIREAVEQVVMMTPNYWHLSDEVRKRIGEMGDTDVEADFVCMVFSKPR